MMNANVSPIIDERMEIDYICTYRNSVRPAPDTLNETLSKNKD